MAETVDPIKTQVAPFPAAGPSMWRGIIIGGNGEIRFSWFIQEGNDVKSFLDSMEKHAIESGFSERITNELRGKFFHAVSG